MDKRLILAVAGSGKSKKIIDHLDKERRVLIVTYTEENTTNLESRIINKFGHIPKNITVYSYFTFLYSFCFRPIIGDRVSGINFSPLPLYAQKASLSSSEHYLDQRKRIYNGRISKLFNKYPEKMDMLIARIEKYYDTFCIDEVQDFAANDFNLIMEFSRLNIELLFLGDFYQHTFETSRDGNIRTNLHKKGLEYYLRQFEANGYIVDSTSLLKSYRCSPDVCSFVSKQLGISIESHREDGVTVAYIDDEDKIEMLFNDQSVVKLFYEDSHKYMGYTYNWGKVKGMDVFNDVCVILNKSTKNHFEKNTLYQIKQRTKNKLYVACTRAKGNLFFVPYNMVEKYKLE